MKRHTKTVTIATVVLLAVCAAAQSRPDFSGRWTSEPEPTAPAPGGGGQRGTGGRSGERAGDLGSGWGSNIAAT